MIVSKKYAEESTSPSTTSPSTTSPSNSFPSTTPPPPPPLPYSPLHHLTLHHFPLQLLPFHYVPFHHLPSPIPPSTTSPPPLALAYSDEIQERYEGKLRQVMSGTLYEVFSRVMRVLVGKKITVPGSFKTYVLLTVISMAYVPQGC